MGDHLNLSDRQYFLTIVAFFAAYVTFEIPSKYVPLSPVCQIHPTPQSMILSRTRPSIYVSTLVVLWGAVAAAMAAVQTPLQPILIRFVLGIFEAAFSVSAMIRGHFSLLLQNLACSDLHNLNMVSQARAVSWRCLDCQSRWLTRSKI